MYNFSGDLMVATDQPLLLRPVVSVSTREIPHQEQYAAWREQVTVPFDYDAADDTRSGFLAEQTAWDLGGLVLTRSNLPAITFARTERRARADGIDHWFLSAPRRGTARTAGAERITHTQRGCLKVQSLQGACEGETTGMDTVHLFVPRDFCRGAAAVLDAADNTEVRTGLGALLADYLLNLERRLPLMTPNDLPGLRASIQAMILACVTPGPDTLLEARETIQATMLERARRIIQQRLFSPSLGAGELCLELGVSRSRLYRMFEPLGGVVHYIRHRRLQATHAGLSNPDDRRTILEIAAACGFMDPAEFSRAFKREFGYRPTDARSRAVFEAVRLHGQSRPVSGQPTLSDLLVELQ